MNTHSDLHLSLVKLILLATVITERSNWPCTCYCLLWMMTNLTT